MSYIPEEAKDLFDLGFGTDEVVRRKILNAEGKPVSSRTARRWRQEWKSNNKSSVSTEHEDETVITLDTSEVKTLEQMLEECQVDVSLWEVDKYEVTKHEVPRKDTIKHLEFDQGKITGTLIDDGRMYVQVMYNIRIVLKRRQIQPFEASLDSVLKKLRDNPPIFINSYRPIQGEYLFSPQLYDTHFNKRSVDGLYTPKQAAKEYKAVGSALISKVRTYNLPIERIMLPVGNDSLHADNLIGTTTKGTWVELAGDQREAIDAMCEAHVYLIEQLAEMAPVDVVIVPGNHDRYTAYWLGLFLEAWFHNHPHIHVDSSKSPRKYYAYGKVLIGMEHGDKVKPQDLVALMATESPRLWADSSYRIWMRGHLHGKDAMYKPITEQYGVAVMTIPALCDTDEYHLLHGFVGNHRAAEGMLFHKQHGLDTTFPVYVDEINEEELLV